MTKSEKVKKTISLNKERRKGMRLKTISLKINKNKLSKDKLNKLDLFFEHGRLLYNHIIGLENPFSFDCKNTKITTKEGSEVTLLISQQMRQSILKEVKSSILALSKKRKNGNKVGPLKEKKKCNSIELIQFGKTYKLLNKKRAMIQNLGVVNIFGSHQIKEGYELASANLIKKPSGYYLNIIVYCEKTNLNDKEIGINFGIKNTIYTSDGLFVNNKLTFPNKIKKIDKRLQKKKKNSKNYVKLAKKRELEYEKFSNKKNDFCNKTFNKIRFNKKIFIQDELLHKWQSTFFGKEVTSSILGRLKKKLIGLENCFVIESGIPTTKICPKCFVINRKFKKYDIFNCSCGFSEERDLKAAKTILCLGKNKIYTAKGFSRLSVEEFSSIFKSYSFKNGVIPRKQEAL